MNPCDDEPSEEGRTLWMAIDGLFTACLDGLKPGFVGPSTNFNGPSSWGFIRWVGVQGVQSQLWCTLIRHTTAVEVQLT